MATTVKNFETSYNTNAGWLNATRPANLASPESAVAKPLTLPSHATQNPSHAKFERTRIVTESSECQSWHRHSWLCALPWTLNSRRLIRLGRGAACESRCSSIHPEIPQCGIEGPASRSQVAPQLATT